MLASRHIIREKGSLPVDVHPSKTSLLKLPIAKYPAAQSQDSSLLHLLNRELKQQCFERRTSTGSGLFASLGNVLVETLG